MYKIWLRYVHIPDEPPFLLLRTGQENKPRDLSINHNNFYYIQIIIFDFYK